MYNFTDKDRVLKLKQALLPLGFRLKAVEQKDYLKPIGVLAGVKGMECTDDVENPEEAAGYDGPGFDAEMVLMAGFTSVQIDAFIKALRRTGVGKIDYKAVLTESNKTWDSIKLYKEIKEEHEAMSR